VEILKGFLVLGIRKSGGKRKKTKASRVEKVELKESRG
jgi:hypothetical protein